MLSAKMFAVLPLLLVVAASPVRRANSTGGDCPAFALQDYSDFQISDGTGGNAQAEANAVFVTPFGGCDLSTVDSTSLKNLQTMREASPPFHAAESAETDLFNPAIDAASGADADALQVGKIKNKVLKLTGEIMGLQIQAAQGKDTSDDIAEEQTKLDSNVKLDEGSAGDASQSVA